MSDREPVTLSEEDKKAIDDFKRRGVEGPRAQIPLAAIALQAQTLVNAAQTAQTLGENPGLMIKDPKRASQELLEIAQTINLALMVPMQHAVEELGHETVQAALDDVARLLKPPEAVSLEATEADQAAALPAADPCITKAPPIAKGEAPAHYISRSRAIINRSKPTATQIILDTNEGRPFLVCQHLASGLREFTHHETEHGARAFVERMQGRKDRPALTASFIYGLHLGTWETPFWAKSHI